jgi:hypothetical protein
MEQAAGFKLKIFVFTPCSAKLSVSLSLFIGFDDRITIIEDNINNTARLQTSRSNRELMRPAIVRG